MRITGFPEIGHTPIRYDKLLDCTLKLEYTNPSGSHKDRETRWILDHYGHDKKYLVVSEGNAGISASYWMGKNVLVMVPNGTSEGRINMIRKFGAEVISDGEYYYDTYLIGEKIAKEKGMIDVSPGEVERWKGDATIGPELREVNTDYIFIPAAGLNLSYAVAYAYQSMLDMGEIEKAPTLVACVLPNHPLSEKPVDDVDEQFQRAYNSIYTHGDEGKDIMREFLDFEFAKVDTTLDLGSVLDLSLRYPNFDPVDVLAFYISRNYSGKKMCIVTGIRRF